MSHSVSGDDDFPLTTDFIQGKWTSYVPPHGVRYCYNHVDQVVTYDDITNPNTLTRLEVATETINTVIANSKFKDELQRAPNRELFIRIYLDTKETFGICVLDHNRRAVLKVVPREERLLSESSYWHIWMDFPNHASLPSNAESDMLSTLSSFMIARIMHKHTISSFSLSQCRQLVSFYQTLKHDEPNGSRIRSWFVGYMMEEISRLMCRQHYGSFRCKTPMDYREKTKGWWEHIVDTVFFVLCFGTYERNRRRLLIARADRGGSTMTFQKLFPEAMQGWNEMNLLNAALVTAYMAFLAIKDTSKIQRYLALISTIFSIFSISVGMFLLWKHRPKSNKPAHVDAWRYFGPRPLSPMSLRIIITAFLLSLPFVLFRWALIVFSAATLYYSIAGHNVAALVVLVSFTSLVILAFGMDVFLHRIWNNKVKGLSPRPLSEEIRQFAS